MFVHKCSWKLLNIINNTLNIELVPSSQLGTYVVMGLLNILVAAYTYNVEIYTGTTVNSTTKGHAHNVVMQLMNGLLFEGRTLYTDSYYTSVPLAEKLLDKSTNLCGTVKVNRRFLPVVAKLKQKRGDIVSVENPKGVKLLKWTDKRFVCMLTTCNNHTCTIIEGTSGKLKPDAIFDCNNAKKGVDISDEIASYYNCLRKIIKWYRKIIIELICATSIANAWYIHQKWGTKHFDVLEFRENIIDWLLDEMSAEPQNLKPKRETAHFRQKYPRTARK
uniref:DDE_Tnp_1_7 domain-containing protein n=1 Tax=Glossina austeni TaxID=7395 RepID=A0A1A9VDM4_GLOAU